MWVRCRCVLRVQVQRVQRVQVQMQVCACAAACVQLRAQVRVQVCAHALARGGSFSPRHFHLPMAIFFYHGEGHFQVDQFPPLFFVVIRLRLVSLKMTLSMAIFSCHEVGHFQVDQIKFYRFLSFSEHCRQTHCQTVCYRRLIHAQKGVRSQGVPVWISATTCGSGFKSVWFSYVSKGRALAIDS
jgi:hypothetical protein